MDLDIGTVVDRFTVQSVLGEGGMAVVYLCRHNQLGTLHALKVLTMSSRAIRERLVQEGQVQAMLRHPNIVAVTDIITLNGAPGLVMEYIEGPSLDELIEQTSLSFEQADVLAEGILNGVAHAHAQGLIHRDLKPANIMLALEGSSLVPKVTDFGLAKLLEATPGRAATRTGSTMGTPHYMSPEQVSDSKNVDHRTDVFALGAILYELVCQQRAFGGENLLQIFSAVAQAKFIPPTQLRSDLPDRMERAILGALEPDKDKRIQTVAELRAVWTGQAEHAGGAVPTEPAGPFSADFLSSVSRRSSPDSGATEGGASDPVPSAMTWAGDSAISAGGEGKVISVETLHQGPQPTPAPQPVSKDSAPSMVSGTKLVMGGGAAFLFTAVAAGGVLILVVGLAGLYWMGSGSKTVRVNPPEVLIEAPVEPPPPIPEVPAQPVRPAQPTRPTPGPVRPSPVRPAPVPAPVSSPQPDPVEHPHPEPVEPGAVEVEPDDPAPVASVTGDGQLNDPDPKIRIQGVKALLNEAGASHQLVDIARTDLNRDVQIEAWRVVIQRYVQGIGDSSVHEGLVLEALETGVFSRKEAATVYGRRGDDIEKLVGPLSSMKGLGMTACVDAVVRIGIRTDQRARAREILQARMASSSGLGRKYIERALGKL